MWKDKEYYYAVMKGKDTQDISNWIIVQCRRYKTKAINFKLIGQSRKLVKDSFEYLSTTPVSQYVSVAKAYKELVNSNSNELTVNIKVDSGDKDLNNLLRTLFTLKDDFEGTITMSDNQRHLDTQKVYRMLDRIREKGFL